MNQREEEYVLLVGSEEVPHALEEALTAGTPVRRCPGPPHVYCPVLHGEECRLRHDAKAAVVYLAGEHEFFSPGRWQCVSHGLSPAVAVLEGGRFPSRARYGFAVVGSALGPEGVLAALADLFD